MTGEQTDAALQIATELFLQLDDEDRFLILQDMNVKAAVHRKPRIGNIINLENYRREK